MSMRGMNRKSLLPIALLSIASFACSTARSDIPETCMHQTTLKLGDGDLVVTLPEAQRIRAAVQQFLIAEKPRMEESILWPGEPFIDCEGTVRMGAWILEPSGDSGLRLTYRVATTHSNIVREEIQINHVGERWEAVSRGQVIHHLKRNP